MGQNEMYTRSDEILVTLADLEHIHSHLTDRIHVLSFFEQGPMEQPCLKHNGPTPGFDNINPRPVCTFCLASMKKMVCIA